MADSRYQRRDEYLYGPFVDGPDPLAPPVDLRAALDKIGKDVMEGSSPQQALRELMRQGMKNRRGLDDLARKIWQKRRDLQRDNRLDGTLQEVRELLKRALEQERDTLGRMQNSDDARFKEMELDTLPGDTGGAVRTMNTATQPAGPSENWANTTGSRARRARRSSRSRICSARRCWTSGSPG